MLKTDKIVQIRRQKGKSLRVVREHYVREDIPCQSQLCLANCQQFLGGVKLLAAYESKIINRLRLT